MRIKEVSAVLLLLGAWSCGGDSDDSSGGIDTGLAEDTALRDVSQAESVSACENVRSTIQSRFSESTTTRRVCELYGALLSQNASDCEAMADECVRTTENGTNEMFANVELDFAANLECDGDVGEFAGCTVTVGEYEACMNDRLAQVEEVFAQFDCAQAGTLSISETQGLTAQLSSPTAVASCERLEAECPAAAPFGGPEDQE